MKFIYLVALVVLGAIAAQDGEEAHLEFLIIGDHGDIN